MNNMQRAEARIEKEINRCKELHYRFAKHLSRITIHLVYESLDSTVKNDRRYYSEVWVEDGVKHTRYLGGEDNKEVREIKEKHFLSKALKKLDEYIAKLEKCKDVLEQFDLSKVNDSLPKVYRLTDEHLAEIGGPTAEEKWYEAALREKEEVERTVGVSYIDELKHKAKDGTLVRSKSEVAIANEFIERGKPYIYEMPAHVKPYLLRPDFTFYSNRFDRVIMWEHAGMLGDTDYMASFSERMDKYTRAGLVPCVDIIFTFDTMRGDIDSGIIKAILSEYE